MATVRRVDFTNDFHEAANRQEWLAWGERHGLNFMPIPTWIDVNDETNVIRVLGFHGVPVGTDAKVGAELMHTLNECPDRNPAGRVEIDDSCTEIQTIRLKKAAELFPAEEAA
jgi:hypothetical protein